MKRMSGVVVATVRDVNDPAGMGRIKLTFPDVPDEPESEWAPVARGLAGPSRGAYWMPEVGDEVLAGFHHGMVEHPFVLGFLWNGQDLPPETDTQNRVFITRTGHALRFEDGNKKVILKSAGGRVITLDDNAGTVKIETGQTTITMDGSTITASNGDSSLTIDASSAKLAAGGRQVLLSGGTVAIS